MVPYNHPLQVGRHFSCPDKTKQLPLSQFDGKKHGMFYNVHYQLIKPSNKLSLLCIELKYNKLVFVYSCHYSAYSRKNLPSKVPLAVCSLENGENCPSITQNPTATSL